MSQTIIALIGFGLNLIGTVIGVTWFISNRLNNHERKFVDAMNEHQSSDNAQFAKIRTELVESGDGIRREFGETATALRQHMHDVETWNRDTFLRRDSYYAATKEMSGDIKTLIAQVAKLDRHS